MLLFWTEWLFFATFMRLVKVNSNIAEPKFVKQKLLLKVGVQIKISNFPNHHNQGIFNYGFFSLIKSEI